MTTTLTLNPTTALLEAISYQPSPHYDERPAGKGINMIVIHGISLPPGEFGGEAVEAFFCGQLDPALHPYFATLNGVNVSAHLFIKRNGDLVQFVPFTKRAWHAGESFFQGETRCNDFSIGIELEGTDTIPYEKEQYEQLGQVIRVLMQAYPAITLDRIVGHVDIAPGRKTDPGLQFDWNYLKGILA